MVDFNASVKAIVFDLDGTLYADTEFAREIHRCACRYIAALRGIDEAAADLLVREAKARLQAESGWESSLSAACLAMGIDLAELHHRFAAEIDPFRFLSPDGRVTELLGGLAGSFALAIYTNNNHTLAGRIMEAIGVTGLFRRVFAIDDNWRPKPDRQTLTAILDELGVAPGEALFVGDRYDIDLRLPAELGCRVLLARGGDELLTLNRLLQEEHE